MKDQPEIPTPALPDNEAGGASAASSCSVLEQWLSGSKARWVTITHDDGYGACAGWEVTLGEGKAESRTCGFNRDSGDWDTLEETISRALLSLPNDKGMARELAAQKSESTTDLNG